MSWERDLFAVLDDLEGHAQAVFEAEREAELADRVQAEYAAVTLASRLMASIDQVVAVDLPGLGRVEGTLRRLGEGWCLLGGRRQDWVIGLRHAIAVHGASERSVPEVAWSPSGRLGIRSAMRGLAEAGDLVRLHLQDAANLEVRLLRAGADFVEVEQASGARSLVSYAAVVAVQSREQA